MTDYKNGTITVESEDILELANAAKLIERKFRSAKWEVVKDPPESLDQLFSLRTTVKEVKTIQEMVENLKSIGINMNPNFCGDTFEFSELVGGGIWEDENGGVGIEIFIFF